MLAADRDQEDGVGQRLAIVTGASSGIGAATALQLGAAGWRVVPVARRAERLEELAQRIRAAGGKAHPEALDASDGDAVVAMGQRVQERFGVPGAVVNSAGAGEWRWPEDTPPQDMRRMMGAPFEAAYNTTYAFLRGMIAARSGVVVHIGSPASILPWPSATAYTCSRWALRGLHEALTQDLAGTGVVSSHILFGEVSSEYFEANPDSQQHIPTVGRLIPVSTPAECAEVVVRTLHRPRPVVYHPRMVRAFAESYRLAPGPMRWLARVTGRRR
jgi:uncharacterized protein